MQAFTTYSFLHISYLQNQWVTLLCSAANVNGSLASLDCSCIPFCSLDPGQTGPLAVGREPPQLHSQPRLTPFRDFAFHLLEHLMGRSCPQSHFLFSEGSPWDLICDSHGLYSVTVLAVTFSFIGFFFSLTNCTSKISLCPTCPLVLLWPLHMQ